MSGSAFLDTNVLVYSYAETEPVKKAQALAAIGTGEVWLSTQVLIEFVNVNHRKLKVTWPSIQRSLVELDANYRLLQTSAATIAHATVAQRWMSGGYAPGSRNTGATKRSCS